MPILFKKTKYWGVLFWLHVLINILGVLFVTVGKKQFRCFVLPYNNLYFTLLSLLIPLNSSLAHPYSKRFVLP